jgi:hypothetical protein
VKPDPAVAGKDDKTQVKTPKVKVKRESKSKIIKREEVWCHLSSIMFFRLTMIGQKVVVSEGEQMHSDNENQDPNVSTKLFTYCHAQVLREMTISIGLSNSPCLSRGRT